jgi:lysophospholipase L1-like esterase
MKARLALVAVIALVAVPTADAVPPSSMAATGDSITRAFNTGGFPFIDAPSNSWSTGSSATVNSHYRRLLALNPAIAGRAYNDAVSGADMADLNGQAQRAVSQGVEYVTVLMGANDVCASSEAAMTPIATFRTQFETAMTTLTTGLPGARIYVLSIPDVYRLWEVYRTSVTAWLVWSSARICQSLLANPWSYSSADVARRARVRQRNVDYNTQLAEVCAAYVTCRFDGNAVFNTAFVRSDVTTRDYFHPSLAGQAKLAAGSWAAGYDFTTAVAAGE